MLKILRRLTFAAILIASAILVATSLPTWWGEHLGGYRLLAHMSASGILVAGLPLYAILRWTDWLTPGKTTRGSAITFWLMTFAGFLTIASMFACMLPTTSTATMRTLIDFHGWIGTTMAITAVLHLLTRRPWKIAAAS